MIYKRCPLCGKRIQTGKTCECYKRYRNHQKRRDGIRQEYSSARWKRAREACLQRYDYVDLYALYHDGQVAAADSVHHIYEILDKPELFYDPSNHFPCSAASHAAIHSRYKTDGAETVREELRGYLGRWPS